MPYISTADVDAVLTEDVRLALFTDDAEVGFNQGAFDLLAMSAEADVRSALKAAGYTAPASDSLTNDGEAGTFIKTATLGRFIQIAYDRAPHSIEITVTMREMVNRWREIKDGDVQIPGMTPSHLGAHGTIKFTSSSTAAPRASRKALSVI